MVRKDEGIFPGSGCCRKSRVGRQLSDAVCPMAGNTALRKREKTGLEIDRSCGNGKRRKLSPSEQSRQVERKHLYWRSVGP